MTKKNRFMQGVADMALVKNKTFFIESNQSFQFKIDRYSMLKKGNYVHSHKIQIYIYLWP